MSQEKAISLDACQPPNKRTILERQRRKRISMSCEQLRKLLPTFRGRQNDMASILEMTVEYLRLAHEHLPKCQQSASPSLPAPAELNQRPGEAQFSASVAQPVPGEEASENTQSTPIPFSKRQQSGSVPAPPKGIEAVTVEQKLTAEGVEAGAIVGHPKSSQELVALLCEAEGSSPLLSSTSQRWLTRLSATPEPPSEEDVLSDALRSLPSCGPHWSCSESGSQEILHTGAKPWKDKPEFKLEPEGDRREATGVLPRPEWMSEQEILLPELNPAGIPGSPMLFEDQPSTAWDSKSSLHYLATPEEMEMGFLEAYGLFALDKESEP